MKTIKISDISFQVLLLIAGLINTFWGDENFFMTYFLVGGWQFLSFFYHALLSYNWIYEEQRKYYGKMLLWIVICGLVSYALVWLNMPVILFYLFILLIVTPFMAIWYFIIGLKELNRMKKNELIHLK